jgi:dephospho-CoA kinase
MTKIAVTGGAASGKSTVCECFRRLGAHIIDLDILAREVVAPESAVLGAIVEHFGKRVLAPDGSLDRRKVRGIISLDPTARNVVESLTHPAIFRLLEKQLGDIESAHGNAIVVVEVPLLVEVGIQNEFDVVVLVEANPEVQRGRIMARDGGSAQEAGALLALQIPSDRKRVYADYVVQNLGSIQEIQPVVDEIYGKIAGFHP